MYRIKKFVNVAFSVVSKEQFFVEMKLRKKNWLIAVLVILKIGNHLNGIGRSLDLQLGKYGNFISNEYLSVEPNDVIMKHVCKIYGCKAISKDEKSFKEHINSYLTDRNSTCIDLILRSNYNKVIL